MKKLIDKLFYSDKWNIGYVHQSTKSFIENQALNPNVTWLHETDSDYSADPFILTHLSSVYIFYEELRHLFGKGKIKVIKGFDFGTKAKVSGITPGIHLSYPYIFKDNERTYCIPETATANEVALYEVDQVNLSSLMKKRVLLKGRHFVDSSVIFYQDKYWLFTSIRGQYNEFYIYYADNLEDDFKPHKLNPISTDNKNFRSAGNLFVMEGKLYRPTQNMELRYGGSVIINQILDLTTDAFCSKALFEVPPRAPYKEGLHNISMMDNLIVFDGKRRFFSPMIPVNKIIKKVINKSADFLMKMKSKHSSLVINQ